MAGWGSAIGGLLNIGGNLINNAANRSQNEENRNWETYMSDTAMQRRVGDLRSAGLNPLLAVGQGGASTPGMSPIPMQSPTQGLDLSKFQPKMQASALANQAADTAQKQAQADNINADTKKKQGDTLDPGVATSATQAQTASYTASAQQSEQMTKNLQAQVDQINTSIAQMKAQTQGTQISNDQANKINDLIVQMQKLQNAQAAYKLPVAKMEGDAAKRVDSGIPSSSVLTSAGEWVGGSIADIKDKLGNLWDAATNQVKKDYVNGGKRQNAKGASGSW